MTRVQFPLKIFSCFPVCSKSPAGTEWRSLCLQSRPRQSTRSFTSSCSPGSAATPEMFSRGCKAVQICLLAFLFLERRGDLNWKKNLPGNISRFYSENEQSCDVEIELKPAGLQATVQPQSDTTSRFVRQCYKVSLHQHQPWLISSVNVSPG